jgi:hypothetical protein
MNDLNELGICTMPLCTAPAKWVAGLPVTDESTGSESYPWKLCDCCQESLLGASDLLKGDVAVAAGLCAPDEISWCLEASRTAVAQLKKLEALKKP